MTEELVGQEGKRKDQALFVQESSFSLNKVARDTQVQDLELFFKQVVISGIPRCTFLGHDFNDISTTRLQCCCYGMLLCVCYR